MATVPFRNVFAVEAEFMFTISDSPAFTVVRPSERLAPKKPASIAVTYKAAPSAARTAKLTITCPKQTSTQWVYYLQA
jgi:hydrocephalus-inducing protein